MAMFRLSWASTLSRVRWSARETAAYQRNRRFMRRDRCANARIRVSRAQPASGRLARFVGQGLPRSALPRFQELCYRGWLHVAHVVELARRLCVQDLAVRPKNGQRGHALAERNPISLGEVEIGVEVADVHMNQHEVGFEDGPVCRVVKVEVQHLAVAAPVAAKVEQDALVLALGLGQSGSDLSGWNGGLGVMCCGVYADRGGG